MAASERSPNAGRARLNRSRFWLSSALFLGYLALQVSVPLIQQARERGRWRWSMYGRRGPQVSFSVVTFSGEEIPLETLNRERGVGVVVDTHLNKYSFLPRHLCEHVPEARAVLVHRPGDGGTERIPCAR